MKTPFIIRYKSTLLLMNTSFQTTLYLCPPGFILKMPIWNVPKGGQLFDDTDNWELPTEGFPSGAQKRQHHGYSNEMSHENGKNGNNQEDGDQSDQFTKM